MSIEIRVLGIVGSPRHGNTEIMAKEALNSAETTSGVMTDLIHLGEMDIHPCKADYRCVTQAKGGSLCPTWHDDMEKIYPRILSADAIIMASPVYYGNVSAQMKMMMDRMQPLKDRGSDWVNEKTSNFRAACRNKIGGAIVVAHLRNGGQESAINAIHNFFHFLDMIPVGTGAVVSCGVGAAGCLWMDPTKPKRGSVLNEVLSDEFGLQSARALGKRVAEVAKLLKHGQMTLREE